MKNKWIKIGCVFAMLTFYACADLTSQHVIGQYYLIITDVKEDMSLSYSIDDENSAFVDVVHATVFAVGHNEKYIVAKQHPGNNDQITNYFIVPIHEKNDMSPEVDVMGPLSLTEYESKKRELNIANIGFSNE